MDDAVLMCGIDGIENLTCEYERVLEINGTLEWRSLDMLHNQIVRPDVVQGANVRMIQPSDCVGEATAT